MSRYEEPVTVPRKGPGGDDSTETSHPAFAQIGVSRVSGQINLLDSEFAHNAYMVVRITPTTLMRNLSRDWFFGGRVPYIEVAMSESQWATFVSSPNIGDGAPCTVQYLNGQPVPQIPRITDRKSQFRNEVAKDLEEMVAATDELSELIDSLGLPKGKAALLKNKATFIRRTLTGSIPFVAEQFDEHMENAVENAKQEIHGYMGGVLQRAGLEAITGGALPLQIESKG
jgi:hypothetical protein